MTYQKLSKRQLISMTWWNRPGLRDYDAIICDGAIRSGKTLSMAVGFLLWATASFDGCTFAICGKTIESLRRNVISELPAWVEGVLTVTERRSENKLIVSDGKRSNTFYIFGGRDESSYTLIQGITLAGILLDEVALMPRSFVDQACARCSVEGSRMWFNCNPAGPEHWFYKEWIQQLEKKNALHLHFTMADNLSLGEKIRTRYESLFTGVFYRRYIQGEWCLAEGLIYDNFSVERHVTSDLPTAGRYFISCDYGTLNPFSAGLWCLTVKGVAVRIREYYYDGRTSGKQKTDGEYYEELAKLADGLPIEAAVVDPSAASFITLIRRHGKFSVRRAKNDVLDGIRRTAGFLKSGKLLIGAECKDSIREFGLYVWDEKAADDRPLKTNDHAMDDIRYFCNTILRRQG